MHSFAKLTKQSLVVVMVQSMAFTTTPSAGADLAVSKRTVELTGVLDDFNDHLVVDPAFVVVSNEPTSGKRQDRLEPGALSQMMAQDRQRGGPPQAAIEACADRQEESSCSVITPSDETIDGTCRSGPRGEAPACVPASDGGQRGDRRPFG